MRQPNRAGLVRDAKERGSLCVKVARNLSQCCLHMDRPIAEAFGNGRGKFQRGFCRRNRHPASVHRSAFCQPFW